MSRLVIYIHGKGGNAKEAEHYKSLFPENDVIGFDYRSQNPWEAKGEFSDFYDKVTKEYDSVIVIANSIGALGKSGKSNIRFTGERSNPAARTKRENRTALQVQYAGAI